MGTVLVRGAVKRKPGFLYYNFLTFGFEMVQWTAQETFVRLKWLVAAKKRESKFFKRGEGKYSLIF